MTERAIIFTRHVRKRMEQRGIVEAQVRAALSHPTLQLPGLSPGTAKVVSNLPDGKRLGVVYKAQGHAILVITSYWLETRA